MDDRTERLLRDLRELPAREVATSLRNPRGRSERTFRGPLLLDYARAAGLIGAGTSTADSYFIVTAEDGFAVAVACAEVLPPYSTKEVLLAYEQDGEPVQAGVRLVVPGDDLGGRFILGVVSVEVRQASPANSLASARGALTLAGLLKRPATLAQDALGGFEQTEVETETTGAHGSAAVMSARYGGVRVFDLLSDAGPRLDDSVREDFLSKVVVARGSEGYVAVIAGGEIEPRFMNGSVIVATSRDGGPLPADEGPLRLVVPYDRAPGRFVARLSSLELVDARA